MNKRLYVGGLSYERVDDDVLRALFEPYGVVEYVKVIRDYHTKRSKGFGFVEMGTPEEAKRAIDALHGSVHEGRTITVSEANPPDASGGDRRSGGARGSSGGGYQRRRSGGNGMMGSGAGNGGHRHHREHEEY